MARSERIVSSIPRAVRLWAILAGAAAALGPLDAVAARDQSNARPNVVVIITDDQGYGDLGRHGNPRLRTPALDALAARAVEVSHFYVCPVCSPTRASLMTGRYNYRTGICDTFLGRSMMFADETTLAEHLSAAGYATGIFGKWHLGDCYPMRAMDQGFAASLVLRGGGLRQPSDHPGNAGYFNPTLYRNGVPERQNGYCSDIYTDAAIAFIESERQRPFFVYLPFNCPHSPLEVADDEVKPYLDPPMKPGDFPHAGQPIGQGFNADATAKLYGMVANIDRNVGRLLAALERLQLAENTIVVFLTDNGPQQPRYNAGLRGLKGTVYEGGIHVPFYIRWPARLQAGKKVDLVAGHIDLTPTLLAACGVAPMAGSKPFDGVNVLPVLEGAQPRIAERTLFFQWHRGNVPEYRRAFAIRTERWKLVQAKGQSGLELTGSEPLELFDLQNDPYEMKDVAGANPEIVDSLAQRYDLWFESMKAERGFALPRIQIGRTQEPETLLTQQDWRGPDAQRIGVRLGQWQLDAVPGTYLLKPMFTKGRPTGSVAFRINGVKSEVGAVAALEKGWQWPTKGGLVDVEASAEIGGKTMGADYLQIARSASQSP